MSSKVKQEEEPPPMPDGCRPLSHQVAGHVYGKCKTRAGLLQDNHGSILKLLQTNNRGTREKTFYQTVFGEDQSDPLLLSARDLLCPFKGTVLYTEDPTVEYIKLCDMTTGFSHPCIMDVKIGSIGYDKQQKVEMAKIKYPHMEKLGFQILGMRVYHPISQKYSHYDKVYGRSLDVTSMIEGLAKFFNVEEKIRADVMYSFLVRLQQILDWFEVQTQYNFYSSSLLFIYEADLPPDDNLKMTSQDPTPSPTTLRNWARPGEKISGRKPETYPLKRKKLSDADLESLRDGVERGREAGVDVPKEEKRMTNRGDKPQNKDGELIRDDRKDIKCNGVRLVNGSADGLTSNDRIDESHYTKHKHLRKVGETNAKEELSNCHKASPEPSTHSTHTGLNSWNHNDAPLSDCPHLKPSRTAPIEVRMIDFAHAIESNKRDENYIFGLKMLMQYIETLHNSYVG